MDQPIADTRFQELEERASQLDTLRENAQTLDEHAAVSAKRRFLLLDLEAAGVFDTPPTAEVTGFPKLEAYARAGVKLRDYFANPFRAEYIPSVPAPQSIVAAPVSLDWFRFPQQTPQGFDDANWLAYCEYTLHSVNLSSGGGELLFKINDGLCNLRWRKEDGIHPAIYRADWTKPKH